jgi:3-methyladenine DNA glycosylase AlkD
MNGLERTRAWIRQVHRVGDPARALPMEAYMRHQFPFLGLPRAQRQQVQLSLWEAFLDCPPSREEDILEIIDLLCRENPREFQYTAMEFAWKYRRLWSVAWPEHVYRRIQTQSWWDTVDWWAPKGLGLYLLKRGGGNSPEFAGVMDHLHSHNNLWMKRSALILQLHWKDHTRFDWLKTLCLDHRQTKEFFLAKAMGWALRQYARTNPNAVLEFVKQHPQLPNLTRREALKHLQ